MISDIVRNAKMFHRRRKAFFIRPDGFIYLIENYPGTHEMYAKQNGLPLPVCMRDWARGFFWRDTNSLYFYVGHDTKDYRQVVDDVRRSIRQLLIKVGGNVLTQIHGGMIQGEPGTVWMPCTNFGNVDKFNDVNGEGASRTAATGHR